MTEQILGSVDPSNRSRKSYFGFQESYRFLREVEDREQMDKPF